MNRTTTIILIALVILGALYLFRQNNSSNQVTTPSSQNSVSDNQINSSQDLATALNELDSTDINSLDKDLSQNDTDASAF